jgi:hypothetical protein
MPRFESWRPRQVDGISGLNEGEKIAATVAFQEYIAKNGKAAKAKDLEAYVRLRQDIESDKARKYRENALLAERAKTQPDCIDNKVKRPRKKTLPTPS